MFIGNTSCNFLRQSRGKFRKRLFASRNPVSTDSLTYVSVFEMRCIFMKDEMHHTPVSSNDEYLMPYFSGFVDGEGCFCVSINKSNRHKCGWEFRPSFSVSQNRDRAEVLYLMQNYFGCGNIRPDRSDKTLKFEIRSINDLMRKVIPQFEKYPLVSSKHESLMKFKKLCEDMVKKKHLNEDSLPSLFSLAKSINQSGKRKY